MSGAARWFEEYWWVVALGGIVIFCLERIVERLDRVTTTLEGMRNTLQTLQDDVSTIETFATPLSSDKGDDLRSSCRRGEDS